MNSTNGVFYVVYAMVILLFKVTVLATLIHDSQHTMSELMHQIFY